MEGLVPVVYLPIHDPSTKDWQAFPPALHVFILKVFSQI